MLMENHTCECFSCILEFSKLLQLQPEIKVTSILYAIYCTANKKIPVLEWY